MTLERKSGGWDPTAKKRHRHFLEWVLQFLGITVSPFILAPYLWKTGQDIIRELETQVIKEAGLSTMKDWVIEDEDACDFCHQAAEAGPYPVDDEGPLTHPNCRCTWVPHIEET
jgi:hypothetical protein